MTRFLALTALLILVFAGGLYAAFRPPGALPGLAPDVETAEPGAVTAEPQSREWRDGMAAGNAALTAGAMAVAGRQFSLAIALAQGRPSHPALSAPLTGLAAVYREQNRLPESEDAYLRALAITEDAVGPSHPDVATVLMGLAKTVYGRGRDKEAERLYDRALDVRLRTLGGDALAVAETLEALGALYQARAMEVDADAVFFEAAQIRLRAAGR